jgi:hypothetical protein
VPPPPVNILNTTKIVILPDGVHSPWWRREGHLLHPADLDPVFQAAPQVLIVGQGASGVMAVDRQTQLALWTPVSSSLPACRPRPAPDTTNGADSGPRLPST